MGDQERDALILNVNPNLAARYMVTRMLRSAGYRVAEAATGERAIELARGLPQPDVVVLDVRLSDVDGFEVCRRLKASAETASVKVLHTSAAAVKAGEKVLGLEVGADGYLAHPFESQELIATVRSLLRLRYAELELRARAERLTEADRRKDEFLAMLGHELRNPLAAMSSALALLAMQPPRDPLEARARAVIDRQTKQLARLVGDLLEVARVTRGAIDLRRERMDLRACVETLAASLRDVVPHASERHIEVSVPAAPLFVDGDAARIEQILTNLVDNAVRHTREGGRIEVVLVKASDAEHPEGAAELVVRDDGDGIAPELVPKLFSTFYQIPPDLARSQGGLGLGLSLVKRLTELHGGAVRASSAGVGQGSEFVVRLPLAIAGTEVDAPVATEASGGGVVLLAAEGGACETLRDLAGLWGHRATLVRDVSAAMDAVVLADPDLVLVDVSGVSAVRDVVRRLRAVSGARPRVVAIVARDDETTLRRLDDAGLDGALVAPVDARSLRAVIDEAVRGRTAGTRRSA